MLQYIFRRILFAIPTLVVISIVSFILIQLPPGDFVDAYIAQLASSGSSVSAEEAANLRQLYGLGQPFHVQYGKWLARIVTGETDGRQIPLKAGLMAEKVDRVAAAVSFS